MKHKTEGLARPCCAGDIFLVAGGTQCGNCLASDVADAGPRCSANAADGPCPLPPKGDSAYCWVHLLEFNERDF
jgi:hypothetical protein